MEGKGKPHGQILRKGQIIVVIISALPLRNFNSVLWKTPVRGDSSSFCGLPVANAPRCTTA
jgi:hypothetical protein